MDTARPDNRAGLARKISSLAEQMMRAANRLEFAHRRRVRFRLSLEAGNRRGSTLAFAEGNDGRSLFLGIWPAGVDQVDIVAEAAEQARTAGLLMEDENGDGPEPDSDDDLEFEADYRPEDDPRRWRE